MVQAGVFTALGDLVIVEIEHAAVPPALQKNRVAARAGERQHLAEHTALLQRFEDRAVAVGVQPDEVRAAGEQHAHGVLFPVELADERAGLIARLARAEALEHPRALLVRDALKEL